MSDKTKNKSAARPLGSLDRFVDYKGKIFNIVTCFGYDENSVYGVAVSDLKNGRRISVIPDSLSNTVAEVNQKFANYAKNNRWRKLSKEQYVKLKTLWNQCRRNKPQKHNGNFANKKSASAQKKTFR